MKWIIILQTCFLAQFSFGQTYVPFISTADSSDQWYSWSVCGVDGGGSCLEYYRTLYSLDGDTLINGNNYTQLSAFEHHTLEPGFFSQSPCPYWSSVSTYFAGGIRESNKQVYFYDALNSSERIIYDFNLGVGDTVPDPSGVFTGYAIDSIDSILISSVYRKRFCLPYMNGEPTYIVEGIGSSFGLLQQMGDNPISCNFGFACYLEYETSVFPDPTSPCAENLGIEKQVFALELFPNPTSDLLTIRSDTGSEIEIEMINAFGQIILGETITTSTSSIDISALSKGIYFVKLAVDGKVGVQKLVVEGN